MKKLFLCTLTILLIVACNSNKKNDSEMKSVNEVSVTKSDNSNNGKEMVFEGKLPCADCPGIETTLKLREKDESGNTNFELISIYTDREPNNKFTETGIYSIENGIEEDKNAIVYVLNSDKPENERIYYAVFTNDMNTIYLLDKNKKRINSDWDYSLKRK